MNTISTEEPMNIAEARQPLEDALSSLPKHEKDKAAQLMKSLYAVEPFALVRWANLYGDRGLSFLKHFFKTHPEHIRGVVQSYNLDDTYHMYGSINPGILSVSSYNVPLLKWMLKNGLDPLWKNHKGENMLYFAAQPWGADVDVTWTQTDSRSKKQHLECLKKRTAILDCLTTHPAFGAMVKQKSWSGQDAWDHLKPKFEDFHRRFCSIYDEQHEYAQMAQQWITQTEKAVLALSIDPTPTSFTPSPKPRKI